MVDECRRRSTSQKPSSSNLSVLPYLSMPDKFYYGISIALWISSVGLAILRIPLVNVSLRIKPVGQFSRCRGDVCDQFYSPWDILLKSVEFIGSEK